VLVTRLAPTPSGYLHLGNAVNFLLTAWTAAAAGGKLLLRIDDIDAARTRREYLDDIFSTIALLGLSIDGGPRDPADFLAHHSQSHRIAEYRAALARLSAGGFPMYACDCSRRTLAELRRRNPDDADAHLCRAGTVPFVAGRSVWRARTDPLLGEWSQQLGDFVLWRRDDLPAYQLTSVVDDERLGVTHIVRGADLRASTQAQLWLAGAMGARGVLGATYLHHELVTDALGIKLSKSDGASSVRALAHEPGGPAQIRAIAAEIAVRAGIAATPSGL
jgi:glutamyl-tRNA synthetase